MRTNRDNDACRVLAHVDVDVQAVATVAAAAATSTPVRLLSTNPPAAEILPCGASTAAVAAAAVAVPAASPSTAHASASAATHARSCALAVLRGPDRFWHGAGGNSPAAAAAASTASDWLGSAELATVSQ